MDDLLLTPPGISRVPMAAFKPRNSTGASSGNTAAAFPRYRIRRAGQRQAEAYVIG